MNIRKKLMWLSMAVSSVFILIGCQNMNQFSPEKVIANTLEENNFYSYYGELTFTSETIGAVEELVMEEWRYGKKSRVETTLDGESIVAVYDETKIYLYNEAENEVLLYEGVEGETLYMDPREQVEFLLQSIQDTHEVETVGEEKVAGRDTIYMTATQIAGKKSLIGDQELWIDKENWVVLKMKSMNGEMQFDMEYTKIDFDVKIDESLFEFDIPDGVEVRKMDNVLGEEISVEEIPKLIDQPVVYIPNDDDAHKIETIMFTDIEDAHGYKDVTIDYKRDGLPLMSLTILQAEGSEEFIEEEEEMLGNISEPITIRGIEGYYIDEEMFRSISWTEDGLNYSLQIINPELTLQEVLEWAEEMKTIN